MEMVKPQGNNSYQEDIERAITFIRDLESDIELFEEAGKQEGAAALPLDPEFEEEGKFLSEICVR